METRHKRLQCISKHTPNYQKLDFVNDAIYLRKEIAVESNKRKTMIFAVDGSMAALHTPFLVLFGHCHRRDGTSVNLALRLNGSVHGMDCVSETGICSRVTKARREQWISFQVWYFNLMFPRARWPWGEGSFSN